MKKLRLFQPLALSQKHLVTMAAVALLISALIAFVGCAPSSTPPPPDAPKGVGPIELTPPAYPPPPKDIPLPIGTIAPGTIVPTPSPYPGPGQPGYTPPPTAQPPAAYPYPKP